MAVSDFQDSSQPSNIVLCGPTASGKSALAMAVAERIGAEILSVDSMQVYRSMDIGTAKPTAEDLSRVRHHLIDVVDPNEAFAVSQFVAMADAALADAARRGKRVIISGGTPMYYKALFEGLFEGPSADDAFRQSLAEVSAAALHARLQTVDPDAAGRIHPNDRRRLVRAIEVFELTGRPLSDHQRQWGAALRHRAIWFGINREKELLNRRINARVKQMLADGWIDEVRSLLARFGGLSKTAGEATGYRELIDCLGGRLTIDDAAEQIKIATRQLSRRQIKWLRRWTQIEWLDGEAISLADQATAITDRIDRAATRL